LSELSQLPAAKKSNVSINTAIKDQFFYTVNQTAVPYTTDKQ